MMRVVLLLAAAALVSSAAAVGAPPSTSLTITYWSHEGKRPPRQRYSLTCDPIGGTLKSRAAACRALADLRRPFAPTPADTICSQIYGGPAHAIVSGRIGDSRVWVHLQRRNGCEIDRWQRLAFLLPAG